MRRAYAHFTFHADEDIFPEGIASVCGVSLLTDHLENEENRAAMGVFILRAIEELSFPPPPVSHFSADLPVATKEWMEFRQE